MRAASSAPGPPALPFWQVSRDQRYFCFEAFKQMLPAQFWLGFLAAHTTDQGGWRFLPKAPTECWGPARGLVSPSRKWDKTQLRWMRENGGAAGGSQGPRAGRATRAGVQALGTSGGLVSSAPIPTFCCT